MAVEPSGVVGNFRDFPPLYTEQINDATLSKQLEVWEGLICWQFNSNGLHIINSNIMDVYPFSNTKINRRVSRDFMVLIAQHMVERGFGFYLHSITEFCKLNDCSVWGALCFGKTGKSNKVRSLHEQEYQKIISKAKNGGSLVENLKERRKYMVTNTIAVGVFGKTIDETAEEVLCYLKLQLSGNQVETPYYLFYAERESTRQFRSWPEEHVAFIISTLATQKRIVVTANETVYCKNLNSKELGVQVI
ncbi:-Vacuolar protein-sorting-associated protein 25 [Babesia bigemina]|uniref:-Vacuolar protein-sorting-associated protein 25 n=1 Tax=Babesia bigemina TaxID=5866 RepID=A0A061DC09_BABBI|nr:-Vacuolar protein-sorting-associated protein 25 [Babesia bigemina]CDR98123.1 -Vacuolar protein-sorting-associated protein 25 [Babesia bigemina]|eukprot:XP_012770309.1 -Vacuolar protein-sorting-associated protein 25 [Babesia bigemina]